MELEGRVWKDSQSSWWLVEISFLDIMTQGKTRKEALDMIKDAVMELLQDSYELVLGLRTHLFDRNDHLCDTLSEKMDEVTGMKQVSLLLLLGGSLLSASWAHSTPVAPPPETLTAPSTEISEEVEALLFTPPQGWGSADPKDLPGSVKVMVVGSGSDTFPPSINLGMESYKGTTKDYLKIVKAINESQNAEWKNLGALHTEAGKANLSQVDMQTNWGTVRLMHVILVKQGYAYIMTAAALRDEFPRFYSDFFKAMRSLRFGKVSSDQLTETVHRKHVPASKQDDLAGQASSPRQS